MNIQISYFGMIAEATQLSGEEVTVELPVTVGRLRELMEIRYPALRGLDYRIAVNQEFSEPGDVIRENVTIAFLPPFAGG